jgi:hypothetical protein
MPPNAAEIIRWACSLAMRIGSGRSGVIGGEGFFWAMAASGPRVSASPLGNEAGGGAQYIGIRGERRQCGELAPAKKTHPPQMAAAMG